MSMEELWAAIAADVAEELKTLKEVLLMKPTIGGPKRPIGGGEVPGVPIYTCGGPRWEDFEWPESGKRPVKPYKDPIGDVREPDTGGLRQKIDKSGRPKPKPCGGKDPHDGGKRPIGGGDVPPIEVKPGGPHYPRPRKPIRF